jgi:hypothetical protein
MRVAVVLLVIGCASHAPAGHDAPLADAAGDSAIDADLSCASAAGEAGQCMDIATCSGLAAHSYEAGHCAGPASIQCCFVTPSVADNPPTPAGYKLMMQSEVTPEMTNWAVMILDDPVMYPMFSTTTMLFGSLDVLARVEWHPPDFQNSAVHRGVTLYEPA